MKLPATCPLPIWSQTRLGTKLLVISFVPFVLTSMCILATLCVLADVQAEERTQQTATQIAAECRNAEDSVVEAAALLSLYTRTHNPSLLDDFHHFADRSNRALVDLKDTVQDESPTVRDLARQLRDCNADIVSTTQRYLNEDARHVKRKMDLFGLMRVKEEAIAKFMTYKRIVEQIEDEASDISKRHVIRSPLHNFLRDNMVLAIGATLFVSFAVAWLLARNLVGRLKQLTDKAARLALLKPPDPPKPGSDEIARLDSVFTQMALRLLDAIRKEQSAIACAADIILSVDGEGIIQSSNQAMAQQCGWQMAQVQGLPIVDMVAPEDRPLLQEALHSLTPSRFEAGLRRHDGKTAACLWSTSWSHGQQATVAIIHDVSERKQAEQALAISEARTRMFMQRMPAGLLLLSPDGVVRFANDTVTKLCGRHDGELIGCQFTTLLCQAKFDSPRAFIELLARQARSYRTTIALGTAALSEGETPVLHGVASGDEKRVQLSISAFGRQSGELLYLAVVLDDTERSRFEELKQRLIAMLAHDMATPLVTVQSTLSMVGSGMFGDVDASINQEVASAANESDRVLQVFKNMVRFQKLAAGFSSLTASQMSLSELAEQAVDVVADVVAEKRLLITDRVQTDVYCLGDADKLAVLGATLLQVIVEICSPGSAIVLGSSQEPTAVSWTISTTGLKDDSSRLRPYLGDSYLVACADDTFAGNLDLVLWNLLLYQCGSKVTCTKTAATTVISLIMPRCDQIVASGSA